VLYTERSNMSKEKRRKQSRIYDRTDRNKDQQSPFQHRI
jgi:hypothetical protein